jgi:hypothetical protein
MDNRTIETLEETLGLFQLKYRSHSLKGSWQNANCGSALTLEDVLRQNRVSQYKPVEEDGQCSRSVDDSLKGSLYASFKKSLAGVRHHQKMNHNSWSSSFTGHSNTSPLALIFKRFSRSSSPVEPCPETSD